MVPKGSEGKGISLDGRALLPIGSERRRKFGDAFPVPGGAGVLSQK